MLTDIKRSAYRGFTIIEMAIAMAIFGFLLAAALPSIGVWMDNARIRNVAESLQNGLQTARAEAVRRNQSITFWLIQLDEPHAVTNSCVLSNLSGSWIISVNDPTGHCGEAASTTTSPMVVTGHAMGDASTRVSVKAVQDDGTTAATQVTFNGFGRMTNADTAISQIDVTGIEGSTEYRHQRITITPTGMVRSCDPRVPTSSDDPRKC